MRKMIPVLVILVVYACGRDSVAGQESGVLRELQSMPRSRFDVDGPDGRADRLSRLAGVIARVSAKPRDRAILLTLGRNESAFAEYVGAGCTDIPEGAPDCDGGRARSYWQAWEVACPQAWKLERGSDEATEAFARCALRQMHSAARRCRGRHPAGYWAGGFSGYRSASCTWGPAAARARELEVRASRLCSGQS